MTSDELLRDVGALTEALMRIDSTSGREGEAIAWLDDTLRGAGWKVTRIPVSAGRDSLYASSVDGPCAVTLSTHIDTVPPMIPPRREGRRIHGRGACDAKGIAAAMIFAAERLRARGRAIGLLFVVGEEVSHDGAHAADAWVRTHPTGSRYLINGEPTESTLAKGTKGAVRLIVRTKGQAAHSAYPHLGHSATADLVKLLAELDELVLPTDELLGETTVNIGKIMGGVADNVVAPSAEARLMIRLVTPVETVMPILEAWAAGRAGIEWSIMVPPMKLGVLDGFPTSVAAFATDIPELTSWGTPFLFGPGSIHVAHRDDEFVDVDELEAAVDTYEQLAERLAEAGRA
jgi:acetylornithine deacetylase